MLERVALAAAADCSTANGSTATTNATQFVRGVPRQPPSLNCEEDQGVKQSCRSTNNRKAIAAAAPRGDFHAPAAPALMHATAAAAPASWRDWASAPAPPALMPSHPYPTCRDLGAPRAQRQSTPVTAETAYCAAAGLVSNNIACCCCCSGAGSFRHRCSPAASRCCSRRCRCRSRQSRSARATPPATL